MFLSRIPVSLLFFLPPFPSLLEKVTFVQTYAHHLPTKSYRLYTVSYTTPSLKNVGTDV